MTIDLSFDDLTKVKIWEEFVWKGDLYCALMAPKVETRNGEERVFIRANRRNFAMPSGWEAADVMETREVKIEAHADAAMAQAILQDVINALDPSVLDQIASALESHRDMADRAVKNAPFRVRADVLQSSNMDLVKMLAAYCRVALNAQTGKAALKG